MKGKCLCGTVQYQVNCFKAGIANCHCSQCRKFTGACCGTFAAVQHQDFSWLSGEDNIQTYRSSEQAVRGFCKTCGSSLFYRLSDENAEFEIALGTLDDEPDQSIDANIYCQSRPQWPLSDRATDYPAGRE